MQMYADAWKVYFTSLNRGTATRADTHTAGQLTATTKNSAYRDVVIAAETFRRPCVIAIARLITEPKLTALRQSSGQQAEFGLIDLKITTDVKPEITQILRAACLIILFIIQLLQKQTAEISDLNKFLVNWLEICIFYKSNWFFIFFTCLFIL